MYFLSIYDFGGFGSNRCGSPAGVSSMCTALSEYPDLFDKKTLVLLNVGEETSSLDKMFKSLSDDLAEELNYKIKQLNNTLEPVLILIIGIIVAFVLISIYLPMFKLCMTIQ